MFKKFLKWCWFVFTKPFVWAWECITHPLECITYPYEVIKDPAIIYYDIRINFLLLFWPKKRHIYRVVPRPSTYDLPAISLPEPKSEAGLKSPENYHPKENKEANKNKTAGKIVIYVN